MGWFKKKQPDPLTDRTRELNARIKALEQEINQLSQQAAEPSAPPARPAISPAARPRGADPVFEPVDQRRLQSATPPPATPPVSPMGTRPSGLRAFWERLKAQFVTPRSDNPKLVNYLAAGSLQGLRPLRYEKRVARNRFLLLAIVLFLLLWGIFYKVFRG